MWTGEKDLKTFSLWDEASVVVMSNNEDKSRCQLEAGYGMWEAAILCLSSVPGVFWEPMAVAVEYRSSGWTRSNLSLSQKWEQTLADFCLSEDEVRGGSGCGCARVSG